MFGLIARFEWIAVFVTGVLAIFLHIRFVTHVGGLWRDEVNSVNLASMSSFREVIGNLDYDSFPILFFALLRGWVGVFGSNNDAALRALGCLIGLGVLGALWFNARAFGIRWPVLSLALIGLNPMLIRYCDSTRAYGLGILLILLTFRSFWRLADGNVRPGILRVLAATVLAILSVQCLYYNSVLLAAIVTATAAVSARRRDWRVATIAIGIGALAALSVSPYLPMMRRMSEWTFMVRYPADLQWLCKRVCEVIGSPDPFLIWLWLCCIIVGLAVVVAVEAKAGRRVAKDSLVPDGAASVLTEPKSAEVRADHSVPDGVLFAAITLVVATAGYATFLIKLQYYTQPWYYIALVTLVGCCIEVLFGGWPIRMGASRLPMLLRSGRLLGAFVVLSLAALQAWHEMPIRHTNVDLVGKRLSPLAAKGDILLVPRWECAIPLARYYHGPGEILTIPPIDDHRIHRYDLVLRKMMTVDPNRAVLTKIAETLKSGHRVFVAGELELEQNDVPIPKLSPAYRDENGTLHGGAYGLTWQLETGRFLGAHSVTFSPIEVPIPNDAPIQDFEKLHLGVAEGWR